MNEIFALLRQYAEQLALSGKGADEIDHALTRFLAEQDFSGSLMGDIGGESVEDFAKLKTISPERRLVATNILQTASLNFGTIEGKIRDSVVQVVQRGLRTGQSRRDLVNDLVSVMDNNKHYARTVMRTSKMSLSRVVVVERLLQRGGKWLKYTGANAERKFCIDRLDKVYSIEEIQKMDNGQGLPVLYYGGGYNCIHTWIPVGDDEAAELRETV